MTTVLSMIRVRTGVMEIGQKSDSCLGTVTLGIGRMQACFQSFSTKEVSTDKLKRRAIGLANAGAPNLRYQAGRRSKPVAVGLRWSNILKICHSVICVSLF